MAAEISAAALKKFSALKEKQNKDLFFGPLAGLVGGPGDIRKIFCGQSNGVVFVAVCVYERIK